MAMEKGGLKEGWTLLKRQGDGSTNKSSKHLPLLEFSLQFALFLSSFSHFLPLQIIFFRPAPWNLDQSLRIFTDPISF